VLKRAGNTFSLILLVVDLACTLFAFQLARWLREALPLGVQLDEPLYANLLLYLVVSAIWIAVFAVLEVYDPARALRYIDDVQIVVVATTVAILLFAGVAYLFFRELSRLLFAYFFLLDLIFLTAWRGLLRLLFRVRPDLVPGRTRRVLIVGASSVGREIAQALQEQRWTRLELVGFVNDISTGQRAVRETGQPQAEADTSDLDVALLGSVADTAQVVRDWQIDEVIIALPLHAHERLMGLVVALQELAVNIRLVPDILDLVFIRASVEEFAGLPLIGLREPVIDGVNRLIKRSFDLVVGGLALILASPLMLLIAFAIKLDSPGPVLFCQERVGEGGKLFWMLKFRTMVQGAEEQELELAAQTEAAEGGPPLFDKRPDDPRVTRLGRFLRRTSMDELPQFINVLTGEMSLVGPRPELPWLVQRYLPWQRKRFAVPQGMTGWWQVNGRSNRAEYQLRVEDDLYYIRNYSLLLDVRILWKTIGSVIRGEGAF
jgi:exopolysaccharide biosynthesis polyprenyl glycosylphosphotransferase